MSKRIRKCRLANLTHNEFDLLNYKKIKIVHHKKPHNVINTVWSVLSMNLLSFFLFKQGQCDHNEYDCTNSHNDNISHHVIAGLRRLRVG